MGSTLRVLLWVEIYNAGNMPADLSGWRLWRGEIGDDGLPEGYYYELPPGSILPASGFMLIFRSQSDLYLPASNGDLHLVRADDRIADSFTWSGFPDHDRSFSRYPDGDGAWKRIHVTPGQPNRPFPASRPTQPPNSNGGLGVGIESIARAYQLAADTALRLKALSPYRQVYSTTRPSTSRMRPKGSNCICARGTTRTCEWATVCE